MLMQVLEIDGTRARTRYLDATALQLGGQKKQRSLEAWHPIEDLHDPALSLKTQEYQHTVREMAEKKQAGSTRFNRRT